MIVGYAPFRLSGGLSSPPAKVANAAKAEPADGRSSALATLAELAGAHPDSALLAAPPLPDFEERAAITEYDGGAPRAWAEGFAALQCMPVPRGIPARIWRAMVDGGGRFLDKWGNKADALGWTPGELFGLDKDAPLNRRDRRGAAFFLADAEVVDITEDEITVKIDGAVQRIRRRDGFTIPAWEIFE